MTRTSSTPRPLPLRFGLPLCIGVLATAGAAQAPLFVFSRCQMQPITAPGTPRPATYVSAFSNPDPSAAFLFPHTVVTLNSRIAIFAGSQIAYHNHLGGDPLGPPGCYGAGAFFGNWNPTATGPQPVRIVSPKVLLDRINQRFCIMGIQKDGSPAFVPASAGRGLWVAYSNGANPLPTGCGSGDGWITWQTPFPSGVPAAPAGTTWEFDWNGMGQSDSDMVYSGITEAVGGAAFGQGFQVYRRFRKIDLIQGTTMNPAPHFDVIVPGLRTPNQVMQVANGVGNSLSYAIGVENNNTLRVAQIVGTQANELLLTVPPFQPPGGNGAPTSAGPVDTLDERITAAAVRGNLLYCCHTVLAAPFSKHVVRWYQIDIANFSLSNPPTLLQSGTIDPGTHPLGSPVHAFMPGLDVDGDGSVLVAFARSSADENPGIQARSRHWTDPLGSMPTQLPLSSTSSTLLQFRWGNWTSVQATGNGNFMIAGTQTGVIPSQCTTSLPVSWQVRAERVFLNPSTANTHYGTGFSPTGCVPFIQVNPIPGVGMPFDITLGDCVSFPAAGFITLGTAAASIPVPGGGTLLVDPNGATTVFTAGPLAFTARGPAFVGVAFRAQGAILEPDGFALTDGVTVTIGSWR